MRFFSFKSIGARIRFGYFFITVLLLLAIITVFGVSIHFNNQHNELLFTMIEANRISKIMDDYSTRLGQQILSDRKGIEAEYLKTREEIDGILEYLNGAITWQNADSRQNYESTVALFNTYYEQIEKITQNSEADIKYIIETYDYIKSVRGFIANEVNKLSLNQLTYSETLMNEINNQFSSVFTLISIAAVAVIVAALVYSFMMSSSISKALKKLAAGAGRIASGDLTGEDIVIRTKDELNTLSQAFNNMKNNLKAITRKVHEVGSSVSASAVQLSSSIENNTEVSAQVAAAIEEIANGTEKQAREAASASESVGNIHRSLQDIARNSQSVIQLSSNSRNVVEKGTRSITSFVDQINAINTTMQDAARAVEDLSEKSMQIGKITGVITGIAEQTNLLSLNAAIEAARAGESGKGFAVVADEVKKLAEQSAGAAKQITGMVKTIQSETLNITARINRGVEEVTDAIELVSGTHAALNSIDESNNEVDREVKVISKNIEELLEHVDQINMASRQIHEIADQLAAGSEEIAASTEEQSASLELMMGTSRTLAENAEQMEELIKNLKI